MWSRRDVLTRVAATSLMTATSLSIASASKRGPRVKSLIRRDETIVRFPGSGDSWPMSWAADDRQYVSRCDGYGWDKDPKGMFNSRLMAVEGGPREAVFHDVAGYPDLFQTWREDVPVYYSFSTFALDGRIYQFLSTQGQLSPRTDGNAFPSKGWVGVKAIYSPDNGRTWFNQNGSTPVVWEALGSRSRHNMVFFEEDQQAFSQLSVLQMGKNYQFNRDGYVYVYAPNGIIDGRMNELVMFRVPKAQILHRDAYEFFAGLLANGSARWSEDIASRAVVHRFPHGWVGQGADSWLPSVVYYESLGLYMMANCGWDYSSVLDRPTKASYLGFWVSTHPWGPWTQIHEETTWTPNHDRAARAYGPQIAPKWIASDGKSFWLVWSDYQMTDEATFRRWADGFVQALKRDEAVDWTHAAAMTRKHMPYYAFNTQRVDLEVV
jgi:hypothetical protein